MPYGLIINGKLKDIGKDVQYLLSPQDLCAVDLVPELNGLVSCLKIEGRLKGPEYVALTTNAYRVAVDRHGVAKPEPDAFLKVCTHLSIAYIF